MAEVKRCYNCKNYLEDMTHNSCDCLMLDNMKYNDYDKYFIFEDDLADNDVCPFWENRI